MSDCKECGGTGWIQRTPTTYETDTAEEVRLAWDQARYKCRACPLTDAAALAEMAAIALKAQEGFPGRTPDTAHPAPASAPEPG